MFFKDFAAQMYEGAIVKFNCYLNADGMPNLHSAESCDDNWEPEPGDLSTSREVAVPEGKGGKGGKSSGGKGAGGKEGGKSKSKSVERMLMGETVYVARVRSYVKEKGCGFLSVEPRGTDLDGTEVYAYGQVLEECAAGPGDSVCFFVHWSNKGQPQASKPILRIAAEEGKYALKGTFKPGDEKGHGFFRCEETMHFFGRDVYVNKDTAATLVEGASVMFNAYLNKDGMPNAAGVEPCEDAWVPEAGDLSATREVQVVFKGKGGKKGAKGGKGGGDMAMTMMKGGKGFGDDWGWGGWDDSWGGDSWGGKGGKGGKDGNVKTPNPNPRPPQGTGTFYSGVLKSFNSGSNYGFIECEDVKAQYGGKDVFVIGSQVDMNVGDSVVFELGLNQKGQPQAMNVQLADAAASSAVVDQFSDDAFAAACAEAFEVVEPGAKRQKM